MKLNLEQVKEITTGAVSVIKEDGMFFFNRFTEEQKEYYKSNDNYYSKAHSPAGVKLFFKTDSKNLFIRIKTSNGCARSYFSLDVLVNNCVNGYIDNFSDIVSDQDYVGQNFFLGEYSRNFELGDGEKTVCVHLPWSVNTYIEEISVDDNSFVEGVKPKKKLIAYGDSITQGFDAQRPSNRYIAKLASRLDAEEFNKGIGGEKFSSELAKIKDPFVPDYITVAYGTNDWDVIDNETFKTQCKGFFENLSNNYPDSKIFVITPIWRKDCNEYRKFGAFDTVEKYIREIAGNIKNAVIVSGNNLVPEDENYFGDFMIHPNDRGFAHYEKNLYDAIKKEL